jgi:hypothetical protein
MFIRALQLRIDTASGLYGFSFSFSRNLTVIRGNNSSGKSTFFNSLLYSLGMEELVGGKGERVLPYAVRDYLDHDTQRITVLSSEILLEMENFDGDVVTLRRPIESETKSTKLIEVARIPALTKNLSFVDYFPTYIHDPGSAQLQEGFFHFLEDFLGLRLPRVATTSGTEAKLYLQAVFAAHAVEQKRGWTDYIANIPFYGIRDARTRVAEYILGLGVFETISLRNRLNAEAVQIDQDWRQQADQLRRDASVAGFVLEGVPTQPRADFDVELLTLVRDSEQLALSRYVGRLLAEHSDIAKKAKEGEKSSSAELLRQVEIADQEIQALTVAHERAVTNLGLQRASLTEYEDLFAEAKTDLERNKAAQKLQQLGAEYSIDLAIGVCPTCGQPVQDTLLRESLSGPQMDLQTNIGYLESQSRMLQRQMAGLNESIAQSLSTIADVAARLASKRDYVAALRADFGSSASQSKAALRRQVQIEVEVEALQRLEASTHGYAAKLREIAERLAINQQHRRSLPPRQYTPEDEMKISVFEKNFRANAGSFGYESVSDISEIQINRETLVPGLAQIELREILQKKPKTADIKADSSASDFVRLIWSYLLGLYQTSANSHTPGKHLGVILFDEPGQHSMRWESQRELLLRLADEPTLQSIVAASFDESESVFKGVTDNVPHRLISWEGKLIRPSNAWDDLNR